jgi:uncharacterized protein (DUF2147 family)
MKIARAHNVIYATCAALFVALAGVHAVAGSGPSPLEAVSGRWYTEGHEGGVELYPCGDRVCGRFSWIKSDSEQHTVSYDTHNPDPAERGRPLCHMQFMGNFNPDGKNGYLDGWIYNPRDGGIYSAQMKLIDHDTLDLHGYLFLPLFGESQIWKRASSMPSCVGD